MAECQERLALKKVEIEKLLEKDKLIMAEMSQALGEGNPNPNPNPNLN